MNSCRKHIQEKWPFYLITAVAVILYFCVIYPLSTMRCIDYDSSYQAALMHHSLKGIWDLIPTDFSPPLYAFFLKPFAVVFGPTQEGLRISTFIIYMGFIILCFFPLKRAFDKKTSIFTALCFMFSAANHVNFMWFRPHVLGYFLTTVAFVYAILVYKTHSRKDYVLFTLFSILGMYTHTVSMFSMLGFYIVLLIVFFRQKDYLNLKKIFLSGVVCAVCYIPWLIVLYHQYMNMRMNYWAGYLDFGGMFATMFTNHFIMRIKDFRLSLLMAIFLALIIGLVIISLVNGIKNKKNTNMVKVIFYLFLMPIVIFVFINIFVARIYVDRYVANFSGMCLIVFCYAVSRISITKFAIEKWITVLCSVVIAINFFVASYNYKVELESYNFPELIELIREEGGDNIAFVHANEWDLGIMMYYFPDAHHYVTDDMYTVLTTFDVFPSEVTNVGSPENIFEYEDVFFVCVTDLSTQKWSPSEFYSYSEDFDFELFDEVYHGTYSGFDIRYAKVEVN